MGALSLPETRALKNREILVVEPEGVNPRPLSRVLHRAGARVTTAASGSDALHMAGLGVYEVVVTVRVVPDMDELEFIQSLRSVSPGIHAVRVASEDAAVGEGGVRFGEMDASVSVTAAEEELLDVLCDVLTRSG